MTLTTLRASLSTLWRGLRRATGDDAYERYLEHWQAQHTTEQGGKEEDAPLDRKTFHARRLDEDWSQPRRCC